MGGLLPKIFLQYKSEGAEGGCNGARIRHVLSTAVAGTSSSLQRLRISDLLS